MAITEKRPSTKYTVGAQYICFNEDPEWDSSEFETDVIKLPTVVDVNVADNSDSYQSYASGEVYESDTIVTYKELSVTQLAFDEKTIARMKGDTVDEGIIMSGGVKTRPYFAYGVPIIKKDGTRDMRWYPKCKLVVSEVQTGRQLRCDGYVHGFSFRSDRLPDHQGLRIRRYAESGGQGAYGRDRQRWHHRGCVLRGSCPDGGSG